MANRFLIPAAEIALFLLIYVTFACLAVMGVLLLPFLLVAGCYVARKVPGAGPVLCATLALAPLLSRETLAGWSRILHGQNPGGSNGLLVIIHCATVLPGSGMLLVASRASAR